MVSFLRTPASGSRIVNALVLSVLTLILYAALGWQFYTAQAPCTPCFLQRLALVMAGAGLWLNVRLGPSPLHYTMTMLAAMAGLVVSFWQIVGVSLTGQSDYGVALWGWHVDTWAVMVFGGLLMFSAFMLAWDRKWGDNNLKRPLPTWGIVIATLFLVAILSHAVSIVAACGLGVCPVPDKRLAPFSANLVMPPPGLNAGG